ncbi:hypothetical protein N657DRAFT_466128 [Parathielavia appendiculata]|uniref:Uncharacterized protein n=1 Tax=Parathielavia appendiculata TaxID=2587402 RepID=A0AAN6Z1W3_9PEZI|nr:hypothetical protein N657DRAFT_466128 [Parathielavia appendiculata]
MLGEVREILRRFFACHQVNCPSSSPPASDRLLAQAPFPGSVCERVPVPPVVAFAIHSLPSASGRDKSYPTLFRWYYPPRHRTYLVFAHIKHIMARRTYTLTELLGLRANRAPAEILALAANPEIADIVRRSASRPSGSSSSGRPPTARVKDDSSVTSDELVFKGTVSRRMGRELTREASQNSFRHPARDPAQDAAREMSQGSSQDPSRPMEWKYRGRSETEATTAEPIPAPTGVPAQRDEGFQRFYKAVVSPTHVRVTAGGRIVPNTRGPPSPTVKRTSDNSLMDSQSVADKAAASKPPVAPAAPMALGQPVPVMPQLVPGYPPGFQPIQTPVSFVPMALGTHLPPGFSFAQPAVNPAVMASLAPGNALKDMHITKPGDGEKQGTVKPSMPEPFYYNGQIMYPVGSFPGSLGNPMVPVHMVGVPHGIAPPLSGQYMHPQPTRTVSAASAAPGSSYAPSNHSLSGIPPVVNHIVPANANFNAATPPPISSIKPSDITKKQIVGFKQNLKYHEDQLQYNRHQIDEREMEEKIHIIKGHIQKFEAILRSQLEYEAAHLQATQGKEDKKQYQSTPVADETKAPSQSAPSAASLGYGAPVTREIEEEVNRRISLASYGLNTNISEGGKATFRSPAEPPSPQMNGFPNAASLPSGAAQAPIFQPRGYASTWTGSKYARELKAYEEAEKRLLAIESNNAEHARVGERSVSQPFAAAVAPAIQTEANLHATDNFNRPASTSTKQRVSFGVPYLLGTLPKGVNPRTARDQDYIYKRPLTDEERRARFLYWGKAPKSAVKGLPKFDGKHFYPPSPVKDRSAQPAQESESRTTDSDGDPFRSTTPVQRGDSKGMPASEANCTVGGLTRTLSFETQVNGGSEDFTGAAPLKCRDDSVDAGSVASVDRRAENPGAKLWQAMLKKGPTSSALSSTTAQGFLPHYTGNAAASLTPSLTTNQLSSPRDIASGKFTDVHDLNENGGVPLSTAPEKRGENCPPGVVNSIGDQFKHLAVDATTRRNLTSAFSM